MANLFFRLFFTSRPFLQTQNHILERLTNMKTLIRLLPAVLSFVFLSFELTLAGAPPLQWQKTFGGNTEEEAFSVQQTTEGGYIIAGWTRSYGAGDWDVYLVKTDSAGNMLWQKTFGGSDADIGWSVQQTSDGGYIIAGTTLSYGAGTVYLIKTDPNGNSEWEKTFGGSLSFEEGHSVQQTSDDGYIIAGSTSYFRYDVPTSDIYLIKTDSNGNMQWQETFSFGVGLKYRDYGRSVQQTSDGGYIIAGSTYYYTGPLNYLYPDGEYIIAGFTLSYGAGGYDVYLIKTDPNGNSQWQKTFGASNTDVGRSVQQTSDGGYIIAGYTESYGAGDSDVYLIKTDPNGNSQWQKTFGGSEYEYGGSVQQTTDDGYIIAGYTSSYGAGSADVYLIKTDPNGNMPWQKTYGGSDNDCALSVQQTTDGGYIIAGHTRSYGADEWSDVYLIKLCSDGTLSADLNCNNSVNFEDLAILADQWLQPPGILSADMAPEPGDGIVNFLDFAVLAEDWLETTTP